MNLNMLGRRTHSTSETFQNNGQEGLPGWVTLLSRGQCPLPTPFPCPLYLVQRNAWVEISIFNHPSQSACTVCLNRIFFLPLFFLFNWKEALNTMKVASGTSSQHALHLLLLRLAGPAATLRALFSITKACLNTGCHRGCSNRLL